MSITAEHVIADAVPSVATAARTGRLRRGRATILALGDLLGVAGAVTCVFLLSPYLAGPPLLAPGWFLAMSAAAAPLLWLAIFAAYNLYDNDNVRISISSLDEVRDVFHALATGSLGILLIAQVLRRTLDWWLISAIEIAIFVAASLVLIPLIRGSIRSWVLPSVMKPRRALIIGTGAEAQLVERKIFNHPEYGLEIVAFLDQSPDDRIDGDPGTSDSAGHVVGLIEELRIDHIILASSIASHEEMLHLIRSVRRPDVQISILPRYSEIFTSRAVFDEIEGLPLVTLPPLRLPRASQLLKRSFDVGFAFVLLVLLAPVLAAIAFAVKLGDGGPVFYRQPRRGRFGSTFSIVKFRTMAVGAEARRAEVLHLNEVDGPLFKVKGRDPRVTRVGDILRRTSLDELPQLWNVLRGEMSIVGPRPFVVYEADQITGWATRRLDMTPGVTGLWQVLGRNDIPFDEMTKLDYLYVTNWSLWWDFKILWQTIPVVLSRRGAY